MEISLSVVICAHNPRQEYLTRVLESLRAQSLPSDRWELLLIDNASTTKLAEQFDLSWHPQGRHIREEELGLTPSRLRGIAESRADLIVFVDDDNVLASDYLTRAMEVETRWPILGIWGGQSEPEFEVEPDPKLRPYLHSLALRTTDRDYWSNFLTWDDSHPFGAGMCVRRTVAEEYVRRLIADPIRRQLGRRGQQLSSSEDYDMTRVACQLGLGCGVFRALQLTHLIPAKRLQKDYLLKLYRGTAYSITLLDLIYGFPVQDPLRNWFATIRRSVQIIKLAIQNRNWIDMHFKWATDRGISEAIRGWTFVERT